MAEVVVVDNYDSFTWNLVHLIGPLVHRIRVVRNDETTAEALLDEAPDAIVLSPGPCTPNEAGICLDVVREVGRSIPIFGVCLGMQAIGQAFGGEVVRAPLPMHGKVSTVAHWGRSVFRGINGSFAVPFTGRGPRHLPGRPRCHRGGRRPDHGTCPSRPADSWRAVPPRERPVRERRAHHTQLPRAGGGLEPRKA
jgi:Glutamine amidotransferase class-I